MGLFNPGQTLTSFNKKSEVLGKSFVELTHYLRNMLLFVSAVGPCGWVEGAGGGGGLADLKNLLWVTAPGRRE